MSSSTGMTAWELNGLEPQELEDITSRTVESYVDKKLWGATIIREKRERAEVRTFYEGVKKHRVKVEILLRKEKAKRS